MRSFLRNLKWRRLYCRIVNQEGSPESIAKGVSLGLFVGFGMPLGTHIIIGLPLAFLLKANKFLTVLFTFPVNPYTIPLLYPAQCYLGSLVMGSPMKIKVIKAKFKTIFTDPSWESFMNLGSDIMWPFLIGGVIIGVATAAIGYYASLGMVQRYRKRREAKLRRRLSLSSKREKTVCIKLD